MTAKAKTATAHLVDEYDLQPGECTTQMAMDELHCGLRSVQKWIKEGKLPAQKLRRRITENGGDVIKPVLIFMQEDLDAFKADRDAPAKPAAVSPNTALAARDKNGVDVPTQLMAYVAHKIEKMTGDDERPKFLTVDQAAEEYGLSPGGLKQLIAGGALQRYSGKNGRTMLSRRQIEAL